MADQRVMQRYTRLLKANEEEQTRRLTGLAVQQANRAVAEAKSLLDKLTTRGDLLTHNGSAYTRLPVGAEGTYLRSDGDDPGWSSLLAGDLSGLLAPANGGTGAANTGNLAWPSGGGTAALRNGSPAVGQIGYWSDGSNLAGSSRLTFDPAEGSATFGAGPTGGVNKMAVTHDQYFYVLYSCAGSSPYDAAFFEFRRSRGTIASPSPVQAGDLLGVLSFGGLAAAGNTPRAAQISAWSDSIGSNYVNGYIDLQTVVAGVAVTNLRLLAGGGLELYEQTAPAAPAANGARLYLEDNGSGKTRLMALFSSGAAQQIAIQP